MRIKNIDKTKQFTRGGQITFHNLRMLLQVNKTVWQLYFPVLAILIVSAIYVITPKEVLWNSWYWFLANVDSILKLLDFKLGYFKVPYHGMVYQVLPKNYLSYKQFVNSAFAIIPYLKVGVGIGFVLSFGVFYGIVKWLISLGEKQTANKYIRGARLDTPRNVIKLLKKDEKMSDIVIDGMPMVKDSETQHFLVHGSTGTGKSQLIAKFLDLLRKRGDKVFLYDKGGVYTSTFYKKEHDKILNPFDARSENWNLWHEARTQTDFENMAESLIPTHGETDPFWVNAARTIFGSAAFTMQDNNDRSIKKLLKTLLTAELSELYDYLSETEAAILTSDKIEKTAISIRSVITTYLKSLRFLVDVEQTNKPKFCIRDWICNQKENGWLFLSSNAAQHASLKPLISMWFSMATISLLALPENLNRRIWFICDELPSLHRLPQLPESVAEARKYGGCFILGMQSYAQLKKVYGDSAAKGIFDLMNTAFFFKSPSFDMAELVSKSLGSQEIEDMRENYSYGANTIRDGISIGSQRIIRQIVTPAEIMDLGNMKCYLRLAGSYPVSLLELTVDKRIKESPSFVSNTTTTDDDLDNLIKKLDLNKRGFQVTKKQKLKTKESEKNVPKTPTKEQANIANEKPKLHKDLEAGI